MKWVFKEKQINGEIVKKTRLVERGFKQSDLMEEVYSPVACMGTIRLLLSLSVEHDMHIYQQDVKYAFLNGILKQRIFIQIPDGHIDVKKKDMVCKLKKALYGLH